MTAAEQLMILQRDAEEILPQGELLRRLEASQREGRPLRVKQGFDPTAPDIHLGHTVGLRKLRQFQDLGHQVVLIVGDYTGMVGDPSGRSKTRPQLAEAQVEENARTYLEQFFKVLDPRPDPPRLPVEIHRNGEWFAPMRFMDVMRLGAEYTIARLLERDDFAKRFRDGQPISVHELFYPLMQGYDSVAIRADVELGATEQKFNLLVGRALQETHAMAPQVILTLPVLPGLDGKQRMSKSLGNYVGVTHPPREMFGRIMSLPDDCLLLYWRLVTDASATELRQIAMDLEGGRQSDAREEGARCASRHHVPRCGSRKPGPGRLRGTVQPQGAPLGSAGSGVGSRDDLDRAAASATGIARSPGAMRGGRSTGDAASNWTEALVTDRGSPGGASVRSRGPQGAAAGPCGSAGELHVIACVYVARRCRPRVRLDSPPG